MDILCRNWAMSGKLSSSLSGKAIFYHQNRRTGTFLGTPVEQGRTWTLASLFPGIEFYPGTARRSQERPSSTVGGELERRKAISSFLLRRSPASFRSRRRSKIFLKRGPDWYPSSRRSCPFTWSRTFSTG